MSKQCDSCKQGVPLELAEVVSERMFIYDAARARIMKDLDEDEYPDPDDVLRLAYFLSGDSE